MNAAILGIDVIQVVATSQHSPSHTGRQCHSSPCHIAAFIASFNILVTGKLHCRSYPRQAHRMAALRFIAALASRLERDRTKPFLPVLLRPLFLITEGVSPVPEEVWQTCLNVRATCRPECRVKS